MSRHDICGVTKCCARRMQNLTGRPSRGGEFEHCLGGVGKI